jgi:uncharacterized membrane protein (Fun14 family)
MLSSPDNTENREPSQPAGPPLWKSKSLRLAVAMMLIGLVLWMRSPSERGTVANDRSPDPALATSKLSGAPPAPGKSSSALVPTSPALFRFGASYLGGFFIGWLFRKSLKLALLVGGAATVAIATAKHTGLINVNWAGIEAHVSHSLAWARDGLGAAKSFLTGYLPSTAAGFLGLYKGARRG